MRNISMAILSIFLLSAGFTSVSAGATDAAQRPEPTGEGASSYRPYVSAQDADSADKAGAAQAGSGKAASGAKTRDRSRSRRAQVVTQVPDGLRSLIARHAQENGIPASLAEGVAHVESRFNPSARNGPYMGLMQIHPRTARGVGYQGSPAGLLDPDTNLRYGVRYLAQAYRLAGGDTCRTIMKYQGGHGAKVMTGANHAYCAKVRQHVATR